MANPFPQKFKLGVALFSANSSHIDWPNWPKISQNHPPQKKRIEAALRRPASVLLETWLGASQW